jgi:metallo-beta-lactamase family protein
LTTEESKAIAGVTGRKIIIAGSGLSNGGRVIHHEKRYLPDPKNALLLVGYQAAGSLGRQLEEGAKSVVILGEEVPVRARVESISGYSAHKDSDNLLEFIRHTADTAKRVFVVMGEAKSSMYLAQKIRDYLALDARVPELGDSVELEF